MGNLPLGSCMDTYVVADGRLIMRVLEAPITDSLGATVSGFKVGDDFRVDGLRKAASLAPLSRRYDDHVKSGWPSTYRFQDNRLPYLCDCIHSKLGGIPCVLQVAADNSRRTPEAAHADLEDAAAAASYAKQFNLQMVEGMGRNDAAALDVESVPMVRVAAPLSCQVVSSSSPDVLPRGAVCTISPYPHRDVKKFVFDGTEDFLELPQAFFHYAAFVSGSKEFVCDLQGHHEEENGSVLLVDPVVLRAPKPTVTALLTTVMATKAQNTQVGASTGRITGPSEELFERLHPRCGQMCQTFDPTRRGAKGKKGVCGITCMS